MPQLHCKQPLDRRSDKVIRAALKLPRQDFSCLGTPVSVSEDSGLKAMSKTTGRQYVDLGGECGHRDRRR